MDVKITKDEGKTLVTLSGRVDTTNAEQFQKDIAVLYEDNEPDFVLDCADMDYTSSQGLRIFLMLQKYVTSKSGSMVMTNMKPQVKEVFDITGFSSIINIR